MRPPRPTTKIGNVPVRAVPAVIDSRRRGVKTSIVRPPWIQKGPRDRTDSSHRGVVGVVVVVSLLCPCAIEREAPAQTGSRHLARDVDRTRWGHSGNGSGDGGILK